MFADTASERHVVGPRRRWILRDHAKFGSEASTSMTDVSTVGSNCLADGVRSRSNWREEGEVLRAVCHAHPIQSFRTHQEESRDLAR